MGIIKDPTSWRAGFELGLAGFSFPYSKPRRKPTAYLYNGVRLPALPEWDRGVYPYALVLTMRNNDGGGVTFARLTVSTTPLYFDQASQNQVYCTSADGSAIRYVIQGAETAADMAWGSGEENTYTSGDCIESNLAVIIKWANYDLLDSNGTIYVAESEPIPVYE